MWFRYYVHPSEAWGSTEVSNSRKAKSAGAAPQFQLEQLCFLSIEQGVLYKISLRGMGFLLPNINSGGETILYDT